MVGTPGLRTFSIVLALCVASFDSAVSQSLTVISAQSSRSNTASSASPAEKPSSPQPKQAADDDFRKRVESRWNAARKGEIDVYVVPDATSQGVFTVRVVVTRVPAGSDGMTHVSSHDHASWRALLKLDDEVRVRLSAEDVRQLQIQPQEASPDALIRHLDSGGHAQWVWTVKATSAGENRLQLEADVVYRKQFSPGAPPIVTYPSAHSLLSLR